MIRICTTRACCLFNEVHCVNQHDDPVSKPTDKSLKTLVGFGRLLDAWALSCWKAGQGEQYAIAGGKVAPTLHGGHPGATIAPGDKGAKPPYNRPSLSAGPTRVRTTGARRDALNAQEGA